MATPEALKKVDNLKETEAGSLTSDEEKLLNTLSKSDIESKRKEIEGLEFKLQGDDKPVKLSKIVENMDISLDRQKATYKGNLIPWQSEVGAAVQLYVILHNKGVGTPKVDGKVGPHTTEGIADTQTEIKARGKTEKGENNPELGIPLSMREIATHNYIPEFNNLKMTKKMESLQVIDNDGCLNLVRNYAKDGEIVDSEGNCTIKYLSQIDKKRKMVKVKVDQEADKNVNSFKFAKKISDAVLKAEKDLDIQTNNTGVEDGIDSFKEKNITDSLLKRWARLKDVDFECDSYNNGRIQVRAVSKGQNLTKFMCNNTDLLTNGKFDAGKFNKIIKEKCKNDALRAVNQNIIDRNKENPIPSAIKFVDSADFQINARQSLIKEIDSYKGYEDGFKGTRVEVKKTLEKYVDQKKYLAKKGVIEKAIKEINKLGSDSNSFISNFDAIFAEMEKTIAIKKVPNVKFTYEIYYNSRARTMFDKVGKRDEYTRLVDQIVNKWKNVKEGGDAKYDLKILHR